jgi:hypothetical protein
LHLASELVARITGALIGVWDGLESCLQKPVVSLSLEEEITTMLTSTQKQLHSEMLALSRRHRELEHRIIEGLRVVDREKLFQSFGLPSLFTYCVRALGFTESVSYAFIAVMRKSALVPELATALGAGEITVAKASRITAALTNENAAELLEFAKNHSTREVEQKIAEDSGAAPRGRKIELPFETLELLRRAQDVMKEKDVAAALSLAIREWLARHDPLEKAKRAQAQNSERSSERNSERARPSHADAAEAGGEKTFSTVPQQIPRDSDPGSGSEHAERLPPNSPRPKRSRIPAHIVHAVRFRDQDRCTFIDRMGRRCENRRYLHLHHVKPVAAGGADEVKNLTCLCSDHHALVHQLSFGIDGQVSWVRAPHQAYS